ncbi:MAG: nitroreductase [Candidatus Paceibacteria bacterium]|jgi:nitroreductase
MNAKLPGMNLTEAIRARRSVKHYDPEHRLTEDELKHLMSHTLLAPTSFNMQNWHFVVVTDKDVQAQICAAGWNQSQLKDASATIVLAGNLKGYMNFERTLRNAPEDIQKMFTGMIPGFYQGKEQLERDEATRSISLAAQNMMLTAKDMGYDSCPMIGYDPGKVADIVGLPEDHPPLMIVTVGKGIKPAQGRMGLLNLEEVVSIDRFGNHTLRGELDDA